FMSDSSLPYFQILPVNTPLLVRFQSSLSNLNTLPVTAYYYSLSLHDALPILFPGLPQPHVRRTEDRAQSAGDAGGDDGPAGARRDRKSTRLNSSHVKISYAVFCLKKKN